MGPAAGPASAARAPRSEVTLAELHRHAACATWVPGEGRLLRRSGCDGPPAVQVQ